MSTVTNDYYPATYRDLMADPPMKFALTTALGLADGSDRNAYRIAVCGIRALAVVDRATAVRLLREAADRIEANA